jgi:hypothetical protein
MIGGLAGRGQHGGYHGGGEYFSFHFIVLIRKRYGFVTYINEANLNRISFLLQVAVSLGQHVLRVR